MLNTVIPRSLTAATALLASGSALAHPGSHLEMSSTGLLHHLITSPFHGLLTIGGLVIAAVVIWKVNQRMSSK
ncbi:MAG: hypothetical protein ACWA44_09010 [Thiotrichales bacterium]